MSELAHKSIESLFRSKQFQVFCMSFTRSYLPGGEKIADRSASVKALNPIPPQIEDQLNPVRYTVHAQNPYSRISFCSFIEADWLNNCPNNFKLLLHHRDVDNCFLSFRSTLLQ
jgi:hypothetical protein